MNSLTEQFQKYVGQGVRDPSRYSNEECRVRYALELEANNLGLAVVFFAAGQALVSDEYMDRLRFNKAEILHVSLAHSDAYGWSVERVGLE